MTPQRNTRHTAAITQAKRRSGGICEICGWPAQTFHHETPANKLIAVCYKCHRAKHHYNGRKTK